MHTLSILEIILGVLFLFLAFLAARGTFRGTSIADFGGSILSHVGVSLAPVGLVVLLLGIYTSLVGPVVDSNLYLYEIIAGMVFLLIGYLGARLVGNSMGSIDMGGVILGALISFSNIPGLILTALGLYTLLMRLIF